MPQLRPRLQTALLLPAVLSVLVVTSAYAQEEPTEVPKPLSSVPVPKPSTLDQFVVDEHAAIMLGKALFWDTQTSSDGKVACASCHFHAGADNRIINTLAPSPAGGFFRGANQTLTADDFPFHRLKNPNEPRSKDNPVIFDTSEIVGSQGVVKKNFVEIVLGNPVDIGKLVSDAIFNVNGRNARQVTRRNSPSVINAVFNDRNFWDGRANRFFNGVNPFGDMDPNARVWLSNRGKLSQVRILLDNASLASQAVGPPLNGVEMSWDGRTFPELGRKMFSLRPLAQQKVHQEDSVLGPVALKDGRGLAGVTYASLVRQAFHQQWWSSSQTTSSGHTQMEANFSLFWGLAILMYERTLVSDQTPFDKFAAGNKGAISKDAQKGLEIFLNEGKCINCHSGPEFTGAAISQLRRNNNGHNEGLIEFMPMQVGEAFYDGGFYNIGVRPTREDLGVGGSHPQFGPFSLSRRVQQGQKVDLNGQKVKIGPRDRVAVDGAFKTPGLRNIELTGPYMHNGGMKSLEEVVLFYARRADFFQENIKDLDPDVDGIDEILGDDKKIKQLVEFLKTLTDERVRKQQAPFDHPELLIPHGHSGVQNGILLDQFFLLPAVGRKGGDKLEPFTKTLESKAPKLAKTK